MLAFFKKPCRASTGWRRRWFRSTPEGRDKLAAAIALSDCPSGPWARLSPRARRCGQTLTEYVFLLLAVAAAMLALAEAMRAGYSRAYGKYKLVLEIPYVY